MFDTEYLLKPGGLLLVFLAVYSQTGFFFYIHRFSWLVISFTLVGYFIGSMPFLKPYLKYVITAIIITVTIPVVVRIIREF